MIIIGVLWRFGRYALANKLEFSERFRDRSSSLRVDLWKHVGEVGELDSFARHE